MISMLSAVSTASTLLKKYDVPGPRYTSYPTIVYWDDDPTVDEWTASVGRALDQTEADAGGAALYIHVPFCRSLCTYCGCNTRITRHTESAKPYVSTLLKEWSLYRRQLNREQP